MVVKSYVQSKVVNGKKMFFMVGCVSIGGNFNYDVPSCLMSYRTKAYKVLGDAEKDLKAFIKKYNLKEEK